MPRSGSELLQVLLHQNPKIYGSTTSPLMEYQFAARNQYELPEVKSQNPQKMLDAFIAMCRSMAKGYYESITDRPIVCDKNRSWHHYYEWVDQWNPNPKIICMVRDLRSIIASMEKAYRKNRSMPTGPDNPAELQNLTVDERAHFWLNSLPVGISLKRLLDLYQKDLHKNVLFVRYEDLCADPEAAMNTIYNYIEEEPFKHDFNKIIKKIEEDHSHFGVFGNHNVRKKIEPCKLSDWKDVLPPEVASGIRQSHEWYFNTFEY